MALSVLIIVLLAGCAKQPTEEINTAKASVDAVMAEGKGSWNRSSNSTPSHGETPDQPHDLNNLIE